ncbi:MAG TPA: isopeptide-forming domain-containing fimbrial protein, partial [Solirubrobacterales bacterium]|nr:isopeptide-forming domain-containing fimbrial protein [Solirubrobacterales bacterium]
VPIGLTPLEADGEPLSDGEEVPGSGGAVWHLGSRTITKTVATIAPGAKSSFTYLAEVDNPAVGGAELTNSVESTTASLGAAATGRRTSGTGYFASAADTVRIGGASIEKTSTAPSATPGNPITYHLKVTIPASIELFDTTVRDVIPAGVEFDGYGTVECLSGCPLVNPINEYEPSINGTNGKETIAWDLGDIPALSEPQVIEFTYAAHLLATNRVVGGNVVKGNTEVNAATVSSDLSNKHGEFKENEIPTTFDETSPEAKTTTTVIEPQLTIEKKIKVGSGSFTDGPTVAHSNEPLTYQLIVKNEGNSAADNVEVTDTPDPALTNVQVVPQAGVTVTAPWNETTHTMTLEIAGPLPAGGTTTIEYTAEFVPAIELHDGQQVKNTAEMPVYFGVPKAERMAQPTWEFRKYKGGSDSTEAILDFPTFTLTKTTGLSGNPDTGKAEVGQEFPWRIVATNTSATAGATNVKVTDTLPPNWTYTEGTAKFNGSAAPDPTITPEAGGDTLEWTVPSLPAASSVVITYGAKPQLAAETNPGIGAEANVNTASISSATDEAGNSGDEEGPYGTAPDTAKATLGMPALTLEKTPDGGSAKAGRPSSFTIKVKNTGNAIARELDVKDVMPEGLSYTPGAAVGSPAAIATETVNPNTPGSGETTIHWHLESLAENETETITVPVSVAANVIDGETLVNEASVTSQEVTTPAEDEGSLIVSTEADMSIEKSGAAAYTAGENYTWLLRVKNLGPSDAQGVEVKDPLPAGTTFVSASAPCGPSGGEVTCVIGTAPVGFEQTYDVTVEVASGTTASPLNNTATVSSATEDIFPLDNSSTFGPTASPLADVSVVKTAAPEAILFSQETEFTLEVSNAGPSTARAVKVVDPLPTEGLEFVSADAPCTEAGGTVTCEFGDLTPGGTETVHVKAKGVKDGVWANTATVETTTPEPPGDEGNNHSTAEVSVGPVADLAIVKTGPATVAAGGQITWALEVTDNGPDNATGVKAVDTLPAGVQFVSADSGCTNAGGTVTCAIGNLAFGESAVRHITATVPPALGDQVLLNTAVVIGEQGDLEPENNHSEAKTTVGPSADLALTKTGPTRVNADGSITWTLVATNNGPSTATGVTVDDTLPGGVTLTSSSPSQGSCTGSLSCALGTLPTGASAQIQVVAHVPASLQNTTITNNAKISGDQPDPVSSNNSASASTQVEDPAPTDFNLSFVKSLVTAKPRLGAVLTYLLAVDNEGPATADAVKITDTLPGALEYVSASIPGGKCSAAGPVVTCRLASLAGGVKKKAMLKARATAAGTVKNTASVTSEHADAKQSDNHDGAVAAIRAESAGRAVLDLVKKRLGHGAVEAGKTEAFEIRVKDTGGAAAADVVVCDRLPGTMSFVSVAGARFEQGNACWKITMLAPGESRSFRVVARIDGGLGSRTIRNVATAEADNASRRSAAAPVKVESSGPGRGGGVTG